MRDVAKAQAEGDPTENSGGAVVTPFHGGTLRPWQAGQSGNPGGRPRAVREVAEAAREHTVEAITVLATIMRDVTAPTAARVAAADRLLDRAWGRAPQAITLDARGVADDPIRIYIPDNERDGAGAYTLEQFRESARRMAAEI